MSSITLFLLKNLSGDNKVESFWIFGRLMFQLYINFSFHILQKSIMYIVPRMNLYCFSDKIVPKTVSNCRNTVTDDLYKKIPHCNMLLLHNSKVHSFICFLPGKINTQSSNCRTCIIKIRKILRCYDRFLIKRGVWNLTHGLEWKVLSFSTRATSSQWRQIHCKEHVMIFENSGGENSCYVLNRTDILILELFKN